jgi:putative nucleotidyltransferase with HDIG domain
VEVVIITGFGTLSTAQQALRYGAFDYITKPFNIGEMVSIANKAIQKKRLQAELKRVISDLHRTWAGGQAQGSRTEIVDARWTGPVKEAISRYREMSLIDFIKVLSRTLEEKNSYMYLHSERVDHFSRVLAEALGLPERDQEYLRIAAFLHDIGKVGISNDILNKKGFLSQSEWKEIQKHPRRGVEIVEPLGLPQEVLSIILHHHESFDGRGYPDRLKGEDIPLCSRIIRIVDSYDAMISDRPYRQARASSWTIKELTGYSGSQFDPQIVQVFVDILGRQELPDPEQAAHVSLQQ